VKKYARIAAFAARDALAYMPAFLARNVFFVVIIFVFWSLWKVIFASRPAVAGLTLVQTLWYLTFTEAMELSRPRVAGLIQEEVRDGTLAVTLTRPWSYPAYHFWRSFGEGAVRVVPVLVVGFGLAALFVGPLPGYLRALPFGLVLIMLGLAVGILWTLAIGLLAFWLEEVSPVFWIVQKAIFILGGLFLPIDFFPPGLAAVARWLPFSFSAYWPAITMVNFRWSTFFTGLTGATVWLAVLAGTVALLFAAGRRRVHAQGG
jgi:ABC-2 type transport system permease protein